MVELDQYRYKLAGYDKPLENIRQALDLDNKKKRIEELEADMEAPGFWDDTDKSQKAMKELKGLKDAFEKYDVILSPAAPTTAPKIGDSLSDPLKMYLGDIYTISVNLAGLPGMTVPCGMDKNGLPIGLQLIADCFNEKKMIQTAYTYEQAKEAE